MDWLPPIEVSRISDGGKVRPHKELSDPHSVRLDMSLKQSVLSLFYFRVRSGGTKERCFLSVKSGYRPPSCSHGPLAEE